MQSLLFFKVYEIFLLLLSSGLKPNNFISTLTLTAILKLDDFDLKVKVINLTKQYQSQYNSSYLFKLSTFFEDLNIINLTKVLKNLELNNHDILFDNLIKESQNRFSIKRAFKLLLKFKYINSNILITEGTYFNFFQNVEQLSSLEFQVLLKMALVDKIKLNDEIIHKIISFWKNKSLNIAIYILRELNANNYLVNVNIYSDLINLVDSSHFKKISENIFFDLLKEIKNYKLQIPPHTHMKIMKILGKKGFIEKQLLYCFYLSKIGYNHDINTLNILLYTYARQGEMKLLIQILNHLHKKNILLDDSIFYTIITGFKARVERYQNDTNFQDSIEFFTLLRSAYKSFKEIKYPSVMNSKEQKLEFNDNLQIIEPQIELELPLVEQEQEQLELEDKNVTEFKISENLDQTIFQLEFVEENLNEHINIEPTLSNNEEKLENLPF